MRGPAVPKSPDSHADTVRHILALLLLIACLGYVVSVENRLDEIRSYVMSEPGTQYSSWYSAGLPPVLREVTTKRTAGESVADWNARHDAAVVALRTAYPPI